MSGDFNFPGLPSSRGGGSGFFNSIFSSVGGRAGSWLGDKIFGVPKAKVGGEAGAQQKEYMDALFPGTTALERLGGGGSTNQSSFAGQAKEQRNTQRQALSQQASLQAKELSTRERMQDKQIAATERIAGRTAGHTGTQVATGQKVAQTGRRAVRLAEEKFIRLEKPIGMQHLKNLKAEEINLVLEAQNKTQDHFIKMAEAGIKLENMKQQRLLTPYYEALKASGLVGTALSVAGGGVLAFSAAKRLAKRAFNYVKGKTSGPMRRVGDKPTRLRSTDKKTKAAPIFPKAKGVSSPKTKRASPGQKMLPSPKYFPGKKTGRTKYRKQ